MDEKIDVINLEIIPTVRQVPIKDEPLTHCTISQYSIEKSTQKDEPVDLEAQI